MPKSTIITRRQLLESTRESSEIKAFAVSESLTDLALLNALSATVSHSLRKRNIFKVAFVAVLLNTSRSIRVKRVILTLPLRVEPIEVTSRSCGNVLEALHTFLFVTHRVHLESSVSLSTYQIKNELSEVSTLVIFLIKHTDKRLEVSIRIRFGSRNVVEHDEAIALFNAEYEAVLSHTARVSADGRRVNCRPKNSTLVKSLLFKQPVAVNFRNTVFAHFFTYRIKFLP